MKKLLIFSVLCIALITTWCISKTDETQRIDPESTIVVQPQEDTVQQPEEEELVEQPNTEEASTVQEEQVDAGEVNQEQEEFDPKAFQDDDIDALLEFLDNAA